MIMRPLHFSLSFSVESKSKDWHYSLVHDTIAIIDPLAIGHGIMMACQSMALIYFTRESQPSLCQNGLRSSRTLSSRAGQTKPRKRSKKQLTKSLTSILFLHEESIVIAHFQSFIPQVIILNFVLIWTITARKIMTCHCRRQT
jgi:hypothetical protein